MFIVMEPKDVFTGSSMQYQDETGLDVSAGHVNVIYWVTVLTSA